VKLNLKYPPNAANAPRFARDIIEAAREFSHVNLDYSAGSLEELDRLIEEMRRDGVPVEAVGATLFGFGTYLGEVFVRDAGAQWVDLDETRRDDFDQAIGVQMPDGMLWNPIGKVFKRFHRGAEDSLPFFYRQAVAR
jgi:hypothetical protein